jgi:hypothetical protein
MSKYQVKMSFTALLNVEAESESQAIEKAMDKAYYNYGLEVYEYGKFRIEEEANA